MLLMLFEFCERGQVFRLGHRKFVAGDDRQRLPARDRLPEFGVDASHDAADE